MAKKGLKSTLKLCLKKKDVDAINRIYLFSVAFSFVVVSLGDFKSIFLACDCMFFKLFYTALFIATIGNLDRN